MIATMPERNAGAVAGRLERGAGRIPQRRPGIGRIGRDRADLAGQDDPLSLRRVRLIFEGIAAVHDQVGAVQRGGEEPLVALEFQFVRHHPIGVRQHAVGRHDDVTFDAQRRHRRCRGRQGYCEIVCTTLETGRSLTVGSLASFRSSSSYCGSVCTGALAYHLNDLVAARLQPAQQFGQRFRGVLVEVVHQDDALAELVELLHRHVDHLLRHCAP